MKLENLIEEYNTSDLSLSNLLTLIGKETGQRFSYPCTEWFSKDVKNKNKIIKPISLVQEGNKYTFLSNDKVLFLMHKRPFDRFNSNESLLRTSIYQNEDNSAYDIHNDQFFLGTNGLYDCDDVFFNKYRYITFTNKGNVYYEAYVDKNKGTIKKVFFDKNREAESKYFYEFKKKDKDIDRPSYACNKIESFLDSEFPTLRGNMYRQTFADLIDQYYYDTRLINRLYKYSDMYITRRSKIVLEDREQGNVSGFSIKAKENRNKESYIALTNPTVPDLKLLCVTDFVNGSKLNKALSKFITLELKEWFYDLDGDCLKDEKHILMSLGDKILEINQIVNEQANLYKKKNKNVDSKRVIGSALGLSLITKSNTYFINYGDTRIYSYLNDELSRLTNDDTIVWDLYKNNELSYDEAISYQKGSVLTNYIGNPDKCFKLPGLYSIKNDSYDKLFVFSDGITDNLTDKTINSIIRVNNGGEILREIAVQAYKKQARHDDVTGCSYIKK